MAALRVQSAAVCFLEQCKITKTKFDTFDQLRLDIPGDGERV